MALYWEPHALDALVAAPVLYTPWTMEVWASEVVGFQFFLDRCRHLPTKVPQIQETLLGNQCTQLLLNSTAAANSYRPVIQL